MRTLVTYRQGKSAITANSVKFCLATNKSLAIGTADVDATYERLKAEYPEAKLSKRTGYVLVEKAK